MEKTSTRSIPIDNLVVKVRRQIIKNVYHKYIREYREKLDKMGEKIGNFNRLVQTL